MSLKSIVCILISVALFCSCNIYKSISENNLDFQDYKKFPSKKVSPSTEPHEFPLPNNDTKADMIGLELNVEGYDRALTYYLSEKTNTVAFLIVRRDTLIYEQYFDGFKRRSTLTSFDMSLAFLNALVGIAIDESKIKSVSEPITMYIPELAYENFKFNDVTIEHLLNMTSGIQLNKNSYDNKSSGIDEFRFNDNHYEEILQAQIIHEPGIKFSYQNINLVMLGVILEKATGSTLADYLSEKIWKPIGAQYKASIGLDSKEANNPKSYCCINARAIDYVKLGMLYSNKGKWSGNQIISKEWVDTTLKKNTTNQCFNYGWFAYRDIDSRNPINSPQKLEDSQLAISTIKSDSTLSYRYECENQFISIGKLGQYLYIDPENEITVLRIGLNNDADYPKIFKQISRKLGSAQ